jgi:DNA ligase-1
VRVQLHRQDDVVRAYSRQLRDVTPLVPELVASALQLQATSFIPGRRDRQSRRERPAAAVPGSHEPVQPLRIAGRDRRASRRRGRNSWRTCPLEPLFFDLLWCDGRSYVERPYRERRAALESARPRSASRSRARADATPLKRKRSTSKHWRSGTRAYW